MTRRHPMFFILFVAGIFAGVKVFLISGNFFNHSLWWEEGDSYFWHAYRTPFWKSLFQPDFIYLNFPGRILAKLALFLSTQSELFPIIFKFLSQWFFAFQIAVLLHPVFSSLIPNFYVRGLYVLVLQTQFSEELFFPYNSTYSNLFLLVFAFLKTQDQKGKVGLGDFLFITTIGISFVAKPIVMIPWGVLVLMLLGVSPLRKGLTPKSIWLCIFSLGFLAVQLVTVHYYRFLSKPLDFVYLFHDVVSTGQNLVLLLTSSIFPSGAILSASGTPLLRKLHIVLVLFLIVLFFAKRKVIFSFPKILEIKIIVVFLITGFLTTFYIVSVYPKSPMHGATSLNIVELFSRQVITSYYCLSFLIVILFSHAVQCRKAFLVTFFIASVGQNFLLAREKRVPLYSPHYVTGFEYDRFAFISTKLVQDEYRCFPLSPLDRSLKCRLWNKHSELYSLTPGQSFDLKKVSFSSRLAKAVLIKMPWDPKPFPHCISPDSESAVNYEFNGKWAYIEPASNRASLVLNNDCPETVKIGVYYLY